jgi:hypothetical protein
MIDGQHIYLVPSAFDSLVFGSNVGQPATVVSEDLAGLLSPYRQMPQLEHAVFFLRPYQFLIRQSVVFKAVLSQLLAES